MNVQLDSKTHTRVHICMLKISFIPFLLFVFLSSLLGAAHLSGFAFACVCVFLCLKNESSYMFLTVWLFTSFKQTWCKPVEKTLPPLSMENAC